MKKLFFLAMALCTLTAFAQTNLFNASQASVLSTWGAGNVNPTATWDATAGQLSITLNTTQAGWQWGNQVALGHNVDFVAGKYYMVTMQILADANCGGVTFKVDDNSSMLFEDQTINLVANTPYAYTSAAVAGVPGNHKMVFDFGYGAQGTNITVSQIAIVETVAPEIDLCDNTKAATASSNNATAAQSCDGNLGTRWASANADGDSVVWQRNYAEAQTFNRVKFVWEGAYAIDYDIYAGNDCDNMTKIAEVRGVDPKNTFPYTVITELTESVTAKYVRFQGVRKATPYGYSFWEMEVYTAQTSVLTSLDFTAAASICKVGANVTLTATPKDQYGVAMTDQTVTYTVAPTTAGHVTDGVYTADAAGLATITATCGEFSKTVEIRNYAGENRVLSTNITTDNKIISQSCDLEGAHNAFFAVDANEASIWAAMEGDGVPTDSACWFVADMGALYDLEFATVKFEGASSKAYTIEVSADNVDWTVIVANGTTPGMKTITNVHDMSAALGVRYVKYHSTENATQYGHKIYDFKVFGVAHTATAIENVEAVKATKLFRDGRMLILRGEHVYDAQGRMIQ